MNHEKKAPSKLFMLSLFMSLFVAGIPVIISGLLLIDIGQTFGYPVGVTGQIATAYSAIAVIFALIMGVLSARYRHKTLLTAGLLLYVISAVGSYLSPNFPVLIAAYSLTGIGSSIVFPMTATIIGEALPPERRSSALGWVTAGQPFSVLVGSPTVNYIASQYGWRSAFIYFMLPISIAGLALVYFVIPKSSDRPVSSPRSSFEGFRSILSNRSALACLAGALFVQVNLSNVLTYGVSSFRERFLASSGLASLIFSGMALTAFTGSIVGGNIVERFGRKRIVAAASLLLGTLTRARIRIHRAEIEHVNSSPVTQRMDSQGFEVLFTIFSDWSCEKARYPGTYLSPSSTSPMDLSSRSTISSISERSTTNGGATWMWFPLTPSTVP